MDKPVADMVLVPREPTDEMLQAFEDEYVCMFGAAPPSPWSKAEQLFAAMIAAAPQPSLEGEVGELVERLDAQAWEHKLTGIVRQKHDKPSIGMAEGDYEPLVRRSVAAALLQSLSADNARLREELDDFRKATESAEAIHANMLRGGLPPLSIRQALHLHGPDALAKWDRAETAEARLSEAVEVLKPFAEASANLDGSHSDGSPIWESPAAMGIDAKHLRAAQSFLDTQGGGNG